MKYLIPLSAILPSFAYAASSADGVPTVVFYQALNFFAFVAILGFVLRKPIKQFFAARTESFTSALSKAQAAYNAAERQKNEIQERLTQLQNTADESIQQARKDAEALKNSILAEARDLTKTLREEAQRTAEFEIARAKVELREEMLTQSVAGAGKLLMERIQEPDQKRLQIEFVEKIQVVG